MLTELLFHYNLLEIKNLAKRGETINRDNFMKLNTDIAKIISKMTAFNPDDRYQSPFEVLDDIDYYLAKVQMRVPIRKIKNEFLNISSTYMAILSAKTILINNPNKMSLKPWMTFEYFKLFFSLHL